MIILDIDNCIADDEWRIGLIERHNADLFERYHRYHSLAPWDKCRNWNLFLDKECAVLTGRPELYRHATFEWLRRHSVLVLHLLMRANGDHRPAVKVKEEQLAILHPRFSIECAYDDNVRIVEMYQRAGLKAIRQNIHEKPYT